MCIVYYITIVLTNRNTIEYPVSVIHKIKIYTHIMYTIIYMVWIQYDI